MHRILKDLQTQLGVSLPNEILELYDSLGQVDKESRVILDLSSIGADHWLLNASYFLLRPTDTNEGADQNYFVKAPYASKGENLLEVLNTKISQSMMEYQGESKTFAFAWSNKVVEKDTALVYIFNEKGGVKEIVAHSLNFPEERPVICSRLKDIFNLSIDIYTQSDILLRAKGSAGKEVSYNDVLAGAKFQVFDLESIDDVSDYESIIESISSLTEKKFVYQELILSEQDRKRTIKIKVYGKTYEQALAADTDYIDLSIVSFVNRVLEDNGLARKKLVAFRSKEFGQEVGIAFISRSKRKALAALNSVQLIEV